MAISKEAGLRQKVNGRIIINSSTGIGGLRVEIVDKGVGVDLPLAATRSDPNGRYEVSFSNVDLKKREKTSFDLQARAFVDKKFLGASAVRYNAGPSETLDVLLPDSVSNLLPSEYETLTSTLFTLYKGPLRDLKETSEQQDITYLGNKTGWDARAVALASLADQFGQLRPSKGTTTPVVTSTTKARSASKSKSGSAPGLEPAFYYALFRAGLPANSDSLFQSNASTVEAVWRQAVANGVIPKTLSDQIPAAVSTYQSLSATRLLSNKAIAGTSALGDMLQITLGDDAAKLQRFAELYAQYGDASDDFWTNIEKAFGDDTRQRLQLDSQLGALTLNNATLMTQLHTNSASPLTSTLDLVALGYYDPQTWSIIIGNTIPTGVPGDTPADQKANYAQFLAVQLRLSYPTAVLGSQIKAGTVKLNATAAVTTAVSQFLNSQQATFTIGVNSIDQYLQDNASLAGTIGADVIAQLRTLHRVYQVTPTDDAMNVLLKGNLTSSYAIVKYGQPAFLRDYTASMGADVAQQTFAKAQTITNTLHVVTTNYLTQAVAPKLGNGTNQFRGPFTGQTSVIPSGGGVSAGGATGIPPSTTTTSATLESLFGSLDYCSCDECRSVLGPAAYLVDLLSFTDTSSKVAASADPQVVLFGRRPDIQYLPLTCANTNTEIPYIDLVNETFEWMVSNGSLTTFQGFSTPDDIDSATLIAYPQNIDDNAYLTLKGTGSLFPPPLPFHRPLELLRRLFTQQNVNLADTMATLRINDAIEHSLPAVPYAWRDILMEQLGLAPVEYQILTDSTLTLQQLYGYPSTYTDAQIIGLLSNVRTFIRRIGVKIDDLIKILETRFINPGCLLISSLQLLSVQFLDIVSLHNGTITPAQFLASLPSLSPTLLKATFPQGIVQWVNDNYTDILNLIVMSNPTDPSDLCTLADLELRRADPDMTSNSLQAVDFLRLIRFIRLWRKLGLSIEQTDDILTALSPVVAKLSVGGTYAPSITLKGTINSAAWTYTTPAATSTLAQVAQGLAIAIGQSPTGISATAIGTDVIVTAFSSDAQLPLALTIDNAGSSITLTPATSVPNDPELLDSAFLVLLPRLGFTYRVMNMLGLDPAEDMESTLALWAPIGIVGNRSLYATMFLSSASPVGLAFQRDAVGNVLTAAATFEADNIAALCGAFNLAAADFALIFAELGFILPTPANPTPTQMTLTNISAIYRRSLLARSLSLGVRECLLLMGYTGLNPFRFPDPLSVAPAEPEVIRFIRLVQSLTAADLSVSQALSFVWNDDVSGTTVPSGDTVGNLALTLRTDFAAVQSQFVLGDDPTGSVAQSLLTLVYGSDITSAFFGLLNATTTFTASTTAAPSNALLSQSLQRLTYDSFAQQLIFSGYLDSTLLAKITAGLTIDPAVSAALAQISAAGTLAVGPWLTQSPELQTAYDAYVLSTIADVQQRRTAVIDGLLPTLIAKRKQEQALASVSTAAQTDSGFASTLLLDASILGSWSDGSQEAVTDFMALETPGLNVRFFYLNAVVPGNGDLPYLPPAANLSYDGTTNVLPPNKTTPGGTIAGAWSGFLDCPQDDLYKLIVTTDATQVSLTVGVTVLTLQQTASTWISPAFALTSGSLTPVQLSATGLSTKFIVEWQGRSPGLGLQAIDPQFLYSDRSVNALTGTYTRFLQATSLSSALSLTPNEIAYLGTFTASRINTACNQKLAINASAAVIPAAMANIVNKSQLILDRIPNQETVSAIVSVASQQSSFTANLTQAHDGSATPFPIVSVSSCNLGTGWLNYLPGPASLSTTTAVALGLVLNSVLSFARLKAALSANDERLLAALQNPNTVLPGTQSQNIVLALTGWSADSLNQLTARFFNSAAGDFSSLAVIDNFRRIFDAFSVVLASGVSASPLIAALGNDPLAATTTAFQAAIRSNYNDPDWLTLVKPISDAMRVTQRNALVAWTLALFNNQALTAPASAPIVDIDTPVDDADTLYEWLLMDVQMDCCMLTSRIRMALSCVQLFIERCIRSLETNPGNAALNVDPTCFDPVQWAWRKRFRLWQLNRECFLWPENWPLEDLRDDLSPIFKNVINTLLQNDITNDAATSAYLDYLGNLEQVAKLQPCAMYYVPGDADTTQVVHVMARSPGAKRGYYFRTFDGVSWSAWDQVKLNIEDNPVVLTIWKNRLLCFWLQVIQTANPPPTTPAAVDTGSDKKTASPIDTSNILSVVQSINSTMSSATPATVTVAINLYWSEYHNGQWQPAKSSDTSAPMKIGPFSANDAAQFDRTLLELNAFQDSSSLGRLWLAVDFMAYSSNFLLYNTHTPPVVVATPRDVAAVDGPDPYGRAVDVTPLPIHSDAGTLTVTYRLDGSPDDLTNIFTTAVNPIVPERVRPQAPMAPSASILPDIWTAPFIYSDTCNAFYVTVSPFYWRVPNLSGIYGAGIAHVQPSASIPIMINRGSLSPPPPPETGPVMVGGNIAVTNLGAITQFVSGNAYITRAINSAATVQVGEQTIGPTGSIIE